MKQFLLITLAMLALGCGGNIVLDNPRNESVTFSFDGKDNYDLGPDSRMEISLEAGQHDIQIIKDGEVLADTSFKLGADKEGLVHSGGSNYIVWRQLYGLQSDRKTLLNERWVEFDSIRSFGDFKLYPSSWLFIEKNWDHGLDDPLPESKTMHITKDFVIESKVFRTSDFIQTYRELARSGKD